MDRLAIEAFLFSADFGEDHYLLASSSSSSDSDSECCCLYDSDDAAEKVKAKRARVEGFAEIMVPLFDDGDFKNNFRVSRGTCEKITELVYNDFYSNHKGGWERITPNKAAYVLLWYLGNQETFKQISERFKITQSCAYNIVKVGCQNLSSRLSEFVKWPERDRYQDESKAFRNISKISGIVGAIAVSHLKILKPKDDPEIYSNRKNYHSIAVQGVVGSKRNFIDLFICEGSLEAYEILDKSSLLSKYAGELMDDYFLAGCNSFPAASWLVTPFPQPPDPDRERFNRHLTRACRQARDAFGKLKERFQRLNRLENKDVAFMTKCVEAACVVHNVCVAYEDECEFFGEDIGIFESEFEFEGEDEEKREEVFQSYVEECVEEGV